MSGQLAAHAFRLKRVAVHLWLGFLLLIFAKKGIGLTVFFACRVQVTECWVERFPNSGEESGSCAEFVLFKDV